VNRFGETYVRPHDLELRLEENGTTSEAMVERIVHLGFEVRVELLLADGRRALAQVTRDEAEALDLADGQIVYVRPNRTTVFSEAATPPAAL
jgi:sulfate transport system ATP-binding protein